MGASDIIVPPLMRSSLQSMLPSHPCGSRVPSMANAGIQAHLDRSPLFRVAQQIKPLVTIPSAPQPPPCMTNPPSDQRLGKYICRDVALLEAMGWEALVCMRRGRGDLTDMSRVQHPAQPPLQTLSKAGAPAVLHTKE